MDSIALGQVTVTSGGSTESGSVRIVSKGVARTKEFYSLASGDRGMSFVAGDAFNQSSNKVATASFEAALTSRSPMFPLAWLAAAYANDDLDVQNLGVETVSGVSAVHLQLRRTFSADSRLSSYSRLTVHDVWIETATGLPLKVAFERREGLGAFPPIPMAVEFSDYHTVQGYMYPFTIRKYVNGSLWGVVSIQSVTFNSGVSDAEFQLN